MAVTGDGHDLLLGRGHCIPQSIPAYRLDRSPDSGRTGRRVSRPGFSGLRLDRPRTVELPFSAIGLVWNSMMSMSGGWFFLMITETFVLGSKDFRLRGIGSYMSVAVARGNVPAMLWAIVAMVLMIVLLDQLL